jgi:hypothetical protein
MYFLLIGGVCHATLMLLFGSEYFQKQSITLFLLGVNNLD